MTFVTSLGSVKGLRKMLQVCEKYALTHEMKLNLILIRLWVCFLLLLCLLDFQPNIKLDNCAIKFVTDVIKV